MPAIESYGTSTIVMPSLGLPPFGEELALRYRASPRRYFHSPPILVACLIRRLREVALPGQLGERLLLLHPRVIIFLFFNDDLAPHLRMRHAAQFRTEHLECSGAGGREPEICNRARYHIDLGPELGHIEIMQDV